jgi:hypothetical protein
LVEETSIPASVGLVPVDGLEQLPRESKTAVEATSGATSKIVFVKVAHRLCQLPVQ